MTHEEKNIGGGAEHPGSEEQKISALLSGLRRVEAPKDFDFHLKARIANARPAEYQKAGLFPILKYAMPLGLFVAVGAGVMVNSSYNWQTQDVAGVANSSDVGPAQAKIPEPTVSAGSNTPAEVSESDRTPSLGSAVDVAVRPDAPGSSSRVPTLPASTETPRGYSDSALKPAPTPIIPPEFRGNSNTPTSSNVAPPEMAAKPLAVPEALQSIGIEAELVENKWRVKAVKANTIGEMMGVKSGDKLESIDGRVIDDKTVFKDGSFKVKTIRVRRGEAAVDLQMKKPQK